MGPQLNMAMPEEVCACGGWGVGKGDASHLVRDSQDVLTNASVCELRGDDSLWPHQPPATLSCWSG